MMDDEIHDEPEDSVPAGEGPAPDAGASSVAGSPGGDAPQAADSTRWSRPDERLQARVVFYWYATDLLRSVVMAALLIGGAWYWGQNDAERPEWVDSAAYALAAVILGLSLIIPPLAYARWRFAVDAQLLRMRYGILFVEERLVPVPRMQHVDLMRGPIERLFGLATLVVFTAGNEGSAFRVPGLSRQRAEAIRDGILEARGHDFT